MEQRGVLCREEEERAQELEGMLSFVKHSAALQLPIVGNCFLYTKQPLPGATRAALATPRKATVSVLAHCTDANLQVRTACICH